MSVDSAQSVRPHRSPDLHLRSRDLLLRLAHQVPPSEQVATPYIGQGAVLNALLLVEAARYEPEAGHLAAAAAQLRRGMNLLEVLPLSSSLYRGVTGMGWALATFPDAALLPERDEVLADLDGLLSDGIELTANPNIDIINGLAGLAVYALARGAQLPSSQALWAALAPALVGFLAAWTPDNDQAETSGARNLGLAHGVPGVLLVCAVAAARDLLAPEQCEVVAAAYERLWTAAIVEDGAAWFAVRSGMHKRARVAWCYGGPGVALALHLGRALHAPNAARAALLLRGVVVQYREGAHGLFDSCLCHGHAGLAFALDYFARHGGLAPALAAEVAAIAGSEAARALDSEQRGMGEGVFLHRGTNGTRPCTTFLEGAPGIALGLAAMHEAHPRPWMQLLGLY